MRRKKILNLTELTMMAKNKKLVIAADWRGPIPASLALSFPGFRLNQLFHSGMYEYKREEDAGSSK